MKTNTRPLRVLHIIDTLGGGGSERLVFDIVRLSDESRVKHRVVTIFPEGYLVPAVYAEPLRRLGAYGKARHAEAGAVAVIGSSRSEAFGARTARRLPPLLKKPLASLWNRTFSTWQQVKRVGMHLPSMRTILAEYFRFKPDVIHIHGFYGFKYGLLFKIMFRRPMVHMVPALFSQMEAQGTGWLANYYRRFHHLVDCFALDAGYLSELTGVGVPAEKLLEIHGTLDLEAIKSVKAERECNRLKLRCQLGIKPDALIALSVGRLDPTKGHIFALEALPLMLKQLPDLHWVLLGEGPLRSELERRSKELGVENHAHLIGFDPEPLPYYAGADVYLRTTTIEGENISSRQAIAMGLPTVGFDSGCETDLIARLGHGILVSNTDPVALAAVTCEILSLPDLGSAIGARGIDYCNTHLGIQKLVDDLLSVYSQLS